MKNRVVKGMSQSGILIAAASILLMTACGKSASLKLDKTTYAPGDKVTVTFTAPASYVEKAWVGVIPSSVPHGSEVTNDQNDIEYQYLNKQTSGTLTFTAPSQPGSWDLRMNTSDSNGKEAASVSFEVKGVIAPAPASAAGVSLKLDKTTYAPGEKIIATFTAPASYGENAWVGVIPSTVPHGSEETNDQNDVEYQYLKKQTSGTLTFTAPSQPGSWDLRMNTSDSNGLEVASVTFTVK